MRIPLDYYRILSVPIKATPEQLEQAYSDRLQQQPRREYGQQAILARQQLIKNAYQILSDPRHRAEYDAQFFGNLRSSDFTSETTEESEIIAEPPERVTQPVLVNPTIEVAVEQCVGVLLILHELGEYELVLKLGIDYLNSPEYGRLQQQQDKADSITHKQDIILSLALAYLELGREQWHRREYENAAISGQMGLDLLTQENLFPSVKEEIEVDLYKLRPYRILELIAQNPVNSPERAQGFGLLSAMLAQRQGIEGKGEDRSGLTFDQFLCFIQQLRTYLTSAEQEQLFASETQHDSAIANYLAVYALIARGFALKKPELILRAQRRLEFLSKRQNVYWEQAICSLLLGHTDKAIAKIPQSQDATKIELIRQHSVGSHDILPGLCLYGEKWLTEEVLVQFCDLARTQITLKEYFADSAVQEYLEEIAPPTLTSGAAHRKSRQQNAPVREVKSTGLLSRWRKKLSLPQKSTPEVGQSSKAFQSNRELVDEVEAVVTNRSTATLEHGGNAVKMTLAQQSVALKEKPGKNHHLQSKHPSAVSKSKLKSSAVAQPKTTKHKPRVPGQRKPHKRSKSTLWKGWLFLLSLVMGVGLAGFTIARLFLRSFDSPQIAQQEAQLAISINESTTQLPKAQTPEAIAPKPQITFTEEARQVIQTWLDSKSAAFGKEYKIEALDKILAAPLLSVWRGRAIAYQQGNVYREYEHSIKMRSAVVDKQNPNKATVEAEVKEVAKHYQGGNLDNAQSYDDNLLVRYELIRQGDKWLIQKSEVLKTL